MLKFYHSPHTRSTGVRILLEELGAPHDLVVLNRTVGENRAAAYLAVNPMGKVPAVEHDGAIVTEQVAIYVYLADLFPDAGLAPAIGDRLRGPYLRWIAFYGSSFEPAAVDRALKREPGPTTMSPYGDFDTVIETIAQQLAAGPYLFGERFTAADVLWGTALDWMMTFNIVPPRPEFTAYVQRIKARPAVVTVSEAEAALAATHHPPA
ncbi:MAG: glutathione S-transferase family protein [Acetobacteraceae bacterium]